MADVTISELNKGIPTGNALIPYSTGGNTLGVPVSAILQNAGNIGINGIPGQALDVVGNIRLGQPSISNYDNKLQFWNSNYLNEVASIQAYGDYNLIFNTRNVSGVLAERMRIANTGNVGIGTAAPAERLTVMGNISASGDVISPSVPKFAYAVLSQVGTAPYTVTTLASAHVESITVNPTTADITINWTTNYFNDANYCITFGAQSNFAGNRSQGINIQTGSTKTRNSVTIMAGSMSNGQFYAVPNINVMAIQ